MTDPTETADRIDPTATNEPIDPIEPKDPTDPIDNADPVEPIESTDPLDQRLRTDPSDRYDKMDSRFSIPRSSLFPTPGRNHFDPPAGTPPRKARSIRRCPDRQEVCVSRSQPVEKRSGPSRKLCPC
jgi:hypothetical protein